MHQQCSLCDVQLGCKLGCDHVFHPKMDAACISVLRAIERDVIFDWGLLLLPGGREEADESAEEDRL